MFHIVPAQGKQQQPSQAGQAITEFALIAPMFLFLLAIIFTGSQYLSVVTGLNSSARAGAIVASNDAIKARPSTASNATMVADARTAVEREQGCTSCFVTATSQADCVSNHAGQNCVWVVTQTSPGGNPIEVVHVTYVVKSYLKFVSDLSVTAQAGAEG